MNVAVMIRAIDQDDGVGVYIQHLMDQLVEQGRDHHWYLYYRTEKFLGRYADEPNCTERLLSAPHKLLWDQAAVAYHARRDGADVVFNPKFSIPLLSRIPSVMVIHDANWYVYPEQYEPLDLAYIKLMLPRYLRKCSRLLAISDTVADELTNWIDYDRSKVTTTYACPAEHFRVVDDSRVDGIRAKHGLPERFLLGVTRVWHTGLDNPTPYSGKNVETLIEAYGRARERIPHHLVIAGEAVEEYLLQTGWEPEDLEGIVFTGFVPQEEIPTLYNAAEFFVLPSYYESFSFPLVEAFACGCPTIASADGAVPEVANGAALLADPHEIDDWVAAIVRLADDSELREELRRRGLRRRQDFSWERTGRQTLRALEAAAGTG